MVWQHLCFIVDPQHMFKSGVDSIADKLHARGAEGWELVNVIVKTDGFYFVIMKRPAPPA